MEEAQGAAHEATQEAAQADKRRAGRQAVMIAATIRCPDGREFACVVRDMSPTGARLAVSRRHRLPEAFSLAVPGRESPYPVRRRWQRGDAVGVTLDLPRPGQPAP